MRTQWRHTVKEVPRWSCLSANRRPYPTIFMWVGRVQRGLEGLEMAWIGLKMASSNSEDLDGLNECIMTRFEKKILFEKNSTGLNPYCSIISSLFQIFTWNIKISNSQCYQFFLLKNRKTENLIWVPSRKSKNDRTPIIFASKFIKLTISKSENWAGSEKYPKGGTDNFSFLGLATNLNVNR